MSTQRRIDPRVRAYGKARIDITRRAKDEMDWQRSWKEPRYPFPFSFGNSWKQCVEYRVDDFAAEVGFLMDVLGFPALAFSPSFAMFSSPNRDFTFSVAATPEGFFSTPPDSVRLQFFVENIQEAADELERRGVKFEKRPDPAGANSGLISGFFSTPHGISIDLLGTAGSVRESAPGEDPENEPRGIQIPLPPSDQEVIQAGEQDENEPPPGLTDQYPTEEPVEFPIFSTFEPEDQETSALTSLEFGAEAEALESADSRKSGIDFEIPSSPPERDPVEPEGRNSRQKPSSLPDDAKSGLPSSTAPRPDPFRRNGQGGFPTGSRRARSSTFSQPTRSNGSFTRSNYTRSAAYSKPGGGKQPDEPSSKNGQEEGYNTQQPEPPQQPEKQTPVEPQEQELKYEDIEENDDYDAPY